MLLYLLIVFILGTVIGAVFMKVRAAKLSVRLEQAEEATEKLRQESSNTKEELQKNKKRMS